MMLKLHILLSTLFSFKIILGQNYENYDDDDFLKYDDNDYSQQYAPSMRGATFDLQQATGHYQNPNSAETARNHSRNQGGYSSNYGNQGAYSSNYGNQGGYSSNYGNQGGYTSDSRDQGGYTSGNQNEYDNNNAMGDYGDGNEEKPQQAVLDKGDPTEDSEPNYGDISDYDYCRNGNQRIRLHDCREHVLANCRILQRGDPSVDCETWPLTECMGCYESYVASVKEAQYSRRNEADDKANQCTKNKLEDDRGMIQKGLGGITGMLGIHAFDKKDPAYDACQRRVEQIQKEADNMADKIDNAKRDLQLARTEERSIKFRDAMMGYASATAAPIYTKGHPTSDFYDWNVGPQATDLYDSRNLYSFLEF